MLLENIDLPRVYVFEFLQVILILQGEAGETGLVVFVHFLRSGGRRVRNFYQKKKKKKTPQTKNESIKNLPGFPL